MDFVLSANEQRIFEEYRRENFPDFSIGEMLAFLVEFGMATKDSFPHLENAYAIALEVESAGVLPPLGPVVDEPSPALPRLDGKGYL